MASGCSDWRSSARRPPTNVATSLCTIHAGLPLVTQPGSVAVADFNSEMSSSRRGPATRDRTTPPSQLRTWSTGITVSLCRVGRPIHLRDQPPGRDDPAPMIEMQALFTEDDPVDLLDADPARAHPRIEIEKAHGGVGLRGDERPQG